MQFKRLRGVIRLITGSCWIVCGVGLVATEHMGLFVVSLDRGYLWFSLRM
jgi:hypothetical protein